MAIKTKINPKSIELEKFDEIINIKSTLDTFNNELYGEEDENGERTGGLINDYVAIKDEYFKADDFEDRFTTNFNNQLGSNEDLTSYVNNELEKYVANVDITNNNSYLKSELDSIKLAQGDTTKLEEFREELSENRELINGVKTTLDGLVAWENEHKPQYENLTASVSETNNRFDSFQVTSATKEELNVVNNKFENYYTKTEADDEISTRLSTYVASEDFKAEFNDNFNTAITTVDVSILKDDNGTFVKPSTLKNYATKDDVNGAVKDIDLSGYVANDTLNTTLSGYTTVDNFNTLNGKAITTDNFQETFNGADLSNNTSFRGFSEEINSNLNTYATTASTALNDAVASLNDSILGAKSEAATNTNKAKQFKVIVGRALSCPGEGNEEKHIHRGSQIGSIYFTSSNVIKFVDRANERIISCKVFRLGDEVSSYWKNCGSWVNVSGVAQWVNNQNADNWGSDDTVIKELRCYVVLSDSDITKVNGLLIKINEEMPSFDIKSVAAWVNSQISKGNIKPSSPGFSCDTTSPFLKVINNKVVCDKPINIEKNIILSKNYNPWPINLGINNNGADLTFFYMLDPFGKDWSTMIPGWPSNWQQNSMTATNALPLRKSNIYNLIGSALNERFDFYKNVGDKNIYTKYKIYRRKLKNYNCSSIKSLSNIVDASELGYLVNDQVRYSNIREGWVPLRKDGNGKIKTSPQIKINSIHRGRYISKNYNIYNCTYKMDYNKTYLNSFIKAIRDTKVNGRMCTISNFKSDSNLAMSTFNTNPVIIKNGVLNIGPHDFELSLTLA